MTKKLLPTFLLLVCAGCTSSTTATTATPSVATSSSDTPSASDYQTVTVMTYDSPTGNDRDLSSATLLSTVKTRYDSEGRRTYVSSSDGENLTAYQYTYDEEGTVTKVEHVASDSTLIDYIVKQEDGSWKQFDKDDNEITLTYSYDTFGNIDRIDNEDGTYTLMTYDENGNVIKEEQYDVEGEILFTNEYTYYTTEHYYDVLTTTDNEGTATTIYAHVSEIKDDVQYIVYKNGDDTVMMETDTYVNGLLTTCVYEYSGSETYTIRVYSYE